MKRTLKKFKVKSINKFKYFLNIVVRILKVVGKTGLVCFPMAIALIIVNSLLGVNIRPSYYMMMAMIATLGIGLLLTMINWKKITDVQFKTSNKAVPSDNKNKSQRIQRRRKIS
ncbi:MAG: hypothetical protein RSG52_11025 [Terrisporobacter sp.]|uniref:hypothetical protein n=1 Tax=Terrisporobacter sp. TaxID=1965305 RepID=UPI002FCC914D